MSDDEKNNLKTMTKKISFAHPYILTTPALRLIEEDFRGVIQQGTTYICDIYRKFCFEGI